MRTLWPGHGRLPALLWGAAAVVASFPGV